MQHENNNKSLSYQDKNDFSCHYTRQKICSKCQKNIYRWCYRSRVRIGGSTSGTTRSTERGLAKWALCPVSLLLYQMSTYQGPVYLYQLQIICYVAQMYEANKQVFVSEILTEHCSYSLHI